MYDLKRWDLISIFIVSAVLLSPKAVFGGDILNFENSKRVAPSEYMLRSHENKDDPIFSKNYQMIDLGLDVGIGSDCGKVDFRGTMRAALKNTLDAKYFGDLGRDIMAASPMLAACYFSPTWCSVLKQSQLSAHFLSQMRLNQCALIDKYTDERTEDFYRERQTCVRKEIGRQSGNLESALSSCQNPFDLDLTSWSGGKSNGASGENHLIESSAKWAGLEGDRAGEAVNLAKAFAGDTVVSKGRITVDYGSKKVPATPYSHLVDLQEKEHLILCDDLLKKIERERATRTVDEIITDKDLKKLSNEGRPLIDRETIQALSFLPRGAREEGCRKLSNEMALTIFTKKMNDTLDILTVASQNPNLPPHRKKEIDEKRASLKESTDMTLKLHRERNGPLNETVRAINEEGGRYRDEKTWRSLSVDRAKSSHDSAKAILFDCSDSIWCSKEEGR